MPKFNEMKKKMNLNLAYNMIVLTLLSNGQAMANFVYAKQN